jgi:enoyl-CoA hydratase/carnithine racemase
MTDQRVRIEIADHVAVVTLNRPEKHNALDIEMFDAIIAAIDRLATEPGLRAVVLHGEGKSFCSGLDFPSVMAAGGVEQFTVKLSDPSPNYFQKPAYGWVTLPVPVIAALHGNCLGGGLQIALGADIRIATPDAQLSVMEMKWGLIPDMSISTTLPRLVGLDVAKELTYTARIISGDDAKRLGLVTHLVEDPLAAAKTLAEEIASQSPDAIRRVKRLVDRTWNAGPEQALALEAELQSEVIGQPNQIAAVTAGFSKQPAEFVDPA